MPVARRAASFSRIWIGGAGAPLRAIQEWMGHRDYKTTSIYADYSPDPSQGAKWAEAAFGETEAVKVSV